MMMKKLFLFAGVLASASVFAQENTSSGDFIMLVEPLDEPEFYCFDLAGWGRNVQIEDPLQAHTCKARNATDQMFYIDGDRVRVAGHDRCIQIAGSTGKTLAGSSVLARACAADNPLQQIVFGEDGKLRLAGTAFCIASGAESEAAGGPSHLWRTLTVQNCEGLDASLATWQLGME